MADAADIEVAAVLREARGQAALLNEESDVSPGRGRESRGQGVRMGIGGDGRTAHCGSPWNCAVAMASRPARTDTSANFIINYKWQDDEAEKVVQS